MRSYLILFMLLLTSASFGQWAHGIGGALTDKGTAIAVDAGGNVYVAGFFRGGPVDFDPSPAVFEMTADNGYGDIFFAKYAPDGSLLWANQIGGTDEDVVNSIAVDASGNVYLAGYYSGSNIDFDPGAGTHTLSSSGGWDVFFAKYTTDGAYVWANSIGGTSNDQAYCIKLDGSGNIFIAGFFSSTNMDFDCGGGTTLLSSSGSNDIFFMKYTNAGVFSWAKKIGGTSIDEVYSMALDGSGNIYLTGCFYGTANFSTSGTVNLTPAGDFDVFFAKYTSAGALSWAKNIGGTGPERGFSIAVNASGEVYVAGKIYGGGAIDMDPDGGTQNLFSDGMDDGFLAKYNSSGAYMWKIKLGYSSLDAGKAIVLDAGGNIYITGYFASSSLDFDPSGSTFNPGHKGGWDIYLAKYTSAGAFSWATSIGGSGDEEPLALAADASWLYMAGYYSSSPFDCEPGAGTNNLANSGGYDIVFGKYKIADGLLPVELSSFSAKASAQAVILQWETKTEVNNYGFEVERMTGSEADAVWTKIGFVKGHGNSNSPLSYEFTDSHPLNGKNTYRLKQTDNDGRYEYSFTTEALICNVPGSFTLFNNYPNPANPSTTIKYGLPVSSQVVISVYSALGEKVKDLVNEVKDAGFHEVRWDASGVSSGLYFYTMKAKETGGSEEISTVRKMLILK